MPMQRYTREVLAMKFTSFIASHILKSAYRSTFSKYNRLDAKQLLALPDADLLMAITMKIDTRGNAAADNDALAALGAAQRTAYTAALFDMEVMNGGLFQYFSNTSRNTAPYLSGALKAIGAPKMEALFTGFVAKYGIDTSNIGEFVLETEEEFDEKYAQYPFEEFDSGFTAVYQAENIEALCAAFVREHIDEFA